VVRRLRREVRIYPTLAAETAALARHIAERARESVRERGVFSLVLSGGRTPEGLYRMLARRFRRKVPWRAMEIFFGDERCVSSRSPESNYAMARAALLSRVPILRRRVHRLPGEVRPLASAARRYASQIGPLPAGSDPARARFDMVLLGMGPDGHTASLFPGAPALRERRRSVVAVRRSGQPPYVARLTLTIPALSSAREVCFLVSGEDKAPAVAAVFRAPRSGDRKFPASLVRPVGATLWFLDRGAAGSLPPAWRAS
jgi:6-phosphogluconolactonase